MLMATVFVIMLSACDHSTSLTIGSASTTGTPGTSTPGMGTPSGSSTPTTPIPTTQPGGAPATTTPAHPALQAVNIRYNFSAIAPGTISSTVDIACPPGYLVASGGPLDSGFGHIVPLQNAPATITSWRAQIFNGTATTLQPEFGINCVKTSSGAPLTLKISDHSIGSIAPQTASGNIATSCPAGFVASGGGFTSNSPNFTIANNAPNISNSTTWLSEVYNFGNSPMTIDFQVVCLSAPNLHQKSVQQLFQNGSLDGIIVYQTRAACPADYKLGGGGIDSGYPGIFAPIDGPVDINDWAEKIFTDGQGTYEAQVDVTCLKIG
jgi:hypothetical protein